MLPGSVPFGNWSQTNIVFTSSGGWFDSLLLLPAGLPEPPRGAPAGHVNDYQPEHWGDERQPPARYDHYSSGTR